MSIKRCGLLLVILLISFAANSAAVQAEYLLAEQPYLHNSIITAADVLDTGADQIIAGLGSEVKIYDQEQVLETISGFSGVVTAVAAGDLTGDFRPEILIGTDKGSYYIYQKVQGKWQQVFEQRYLWTPVVYLEVCDITGNGWGDVIVRTARGEAFVYLSWDGKLELFWRSQPNAAVKYIQAADLTGSGRDDVVFTHNSGYVGVLSWQEGQFELVWQNFPWGTIDSLVVAELQSGQLPEIMVVTGQNIVYTWRWNGETIATQRHFPYELEGNVTKIVPGLGLVNISTASGITSYSIGASSLSVRSVYPLSGVRDIVMVNDTMLIEETSGRYYTLYDVDPEQIRIFVDNKATNKPIGLQVYSGKIYLDVDGLASALGLIRFGTKRIFLIKGLDYFVIDPEEGAVLWRNTPLPFADQILTQDGKTYIPISLISLMGYDVDFDYSTSELRITKSWGWW